jgi:hypothetical protein
MTQLNELLVVERRRDLIRAADRASLARDLRPAGRRPRRLLGLWRAREVSGMPAPQPDGGRPSSAGCTP